MAELQTGDRVRVVRTGRTGIIKSDQRLPVTARRWGVLLDDQIKSGSSRLDGVLTYYADDELEPLSE